MRRCRSRSRPGRHRRQRRAEAALTKIQDEVSADIPTLPLLQGKQFAIRSSDVQGVTLDASFKFRLGTLSK